MNENIKKIYLSIENIIYYLKNMIFKVNDNNLKNILKKQLISI